MKKILLLAALFSSACDPEGQQQRFDDKRAEEKRQIWEGPCADETKLLATTTGSPDTFKCWNRAHRIEVQTATLAGEEIATAVTCRCVRAVDGGR